MGEPHATLIANGESEEVFQYHSTPMPAANEARELLSTEESLFIAIGGMAAQAGISPRALLKQLRPVVRGTPDPTRGLNNLHRFLAAGFSSTILRDFHLHPMLLDVALQLFSQSQFLADILVRNPELFSWLTASPALKVRKTPQDFAAEAGDAARLFNRLERKLDSLKRFQRRELLRIGARHILNEADIAVTSAELAALADGIIDAVLRLGHLHLAETTQVQTDHTLAVIGLGKLGGAELNFSSDIDLMFVYDRDEELAGSIGRISTQHEYHNRLSEFIVRRLTEHTAEGHLYRVDMRLRPEGETGPLALSRAGYMVYYESRGEVWERQMLLKARVVAGKRGVGEHWLREVEPFVHPKTMLGSPLQEIARIKARIETRVDVDANVKLGSGGIRDIEFTVQALQLLNAGAHPVLREQGTLRAIAALAEGSFLSTRERKVLEDSYMFLRRVEDRLQLLHGLQRHQLPESKEEMNVLAKQLGFKSVRAFDRTLALHRGHVRKVFTSVFHGMGTPGPARTGKRSGEGDGRMQSGWFRKIGWLHPVEAARHLDAIAGELPELQGERDMKRFVSSLAAFKAPDWCLGNFLMLTSSQPIRRTLQQAVQNPTTLNLLLLLCSRSSNLARLLAREPLLFESLVGRTDEVIQGGLGWEFLRRSDLVRFRQYNEFKALLRWLLRKTTIEELTQELSAVAEAIILDACARLEGELLSEESHTRYSLLALGKFGGGEMNIGSDLDLVFVYSGVAEEGDGTMAQTFVRKLVRETEGAYEIDLQMRPEGKNSPPAIEWQYYKEYLRERASLWERQSLTKVRPIAGTPDFCKEVSDHIQRSVAHDPLPSDWVEKIKGMREQMERERVTPRSGVDLKMGKGGLVDLEFLLQILALRYGREKESPIPPGSMKAVREFVGRKILTRGEGNSITSNLVALRSLETLIRINADSTEFVLPTDPMKLKVLAAGMEASSVKKLLMRVTIMRKENRSLFLHTIRRVRKG
ncbi:MAG: hypothetical protein HYZ01_04590 [Ignavibacteriales bacterium]|nr:hypothetical protein [Ignavibacteriales bacterium]